jgi:GTP cyclohydrolase III
MVLYLRFMAKKAKLPADTNKRAKSIVDMATGENETPTDPIKAAAAALGRKGGLKGGKARAESLTAKQRKEIAKKAAAARWKTK